MDFWEVLKVIARRWIYVVPVLLATVATAVMVPPTIQPTYTASLSTVVVAPVEGDARLNPFLALGTTTTTQAVVAGASSNVVKQQVLAAGNSPSYTVSQQSSRSPILVISAEAATPDTAVATVEQVSGLVDQLMADQQRAAGAVDEMMYTTQDLNQVTAAPVYEGATRVRFLILGLGVMFAVALALLVEGISVVRARRRGEPDALPTARQLELLRARSQLLAEKEALLTAREQLLLEQEQGTDPAPQVAESPKSPRMGGLQRKPWPWTSGNEVTSTTSPDEPTAAAAPSAAADSSAATCSTNQELRATSDQRGPERSDAPARVGGPSCPTW